MKSRIVSLALLPAVAVLAHSSSVTAQITSRAKRLSADVKIADTRTAPNFIQTCWDLTVLEAGDCIKATFYRYIAAAQ